MKNTTKILFVQCNREHTNNNTDKSTYVKDLLKSQMQNCGEKHFHLKS